MKDEESLSMLSLTQLHGTRAGSGNADAARLAGVTIVVGDAGPTNELADAAFDVVGGEAKGLQHLIVLANAQPSVVELDDRQALAALTPGADNDPHDSPSVSFHRATPEIR